MFDKEKNIYIRNRENWNVVNNRHIGIIKVKKKIKQKEKNKKQ